MRFESIRVRGLGPFKREVSIDLNAIDGLLVAFCGVNGAGKTTLLELFCGALFRQTATRGTLAELATARDALVEVRAVNGKAITVRQTVDSHTGKGESLVLDAAGAPLLESGKVSEYKRWAAAHLIAPEVLYSSSVAVQRSYGFLDLSRTERVAVLNRALGTERYERMAKTAAERAKAARAQAEELRRRIAEVPAGQLPFLRDRLAEAERGVATAVEATKSARLAHQRAQAAAADVARAMELVEQRRAAVRRLEAARAQKADLETRIAKNRELLDRAPEIREAAESDRAKRDELALLREKVAGCTARADKLRSDEWAAKLAVGNAANARASIDRRIERANFALKEKATVEAAAAGLAKLREAVAAADLDVQAAEAEEARLSKLTIEGKDQRIAGLRDGLESIARGFPSWEDLAQGALESDSSLAERLAKSPAELIRQRGVVTRARNDLAKARTALSGDEQWAARLPAMEAAQVELEAAQAELAEAQEQERLAELRLESIRADLTAGAVQASDTTADIGRLDFEVTALAPTVALLPHLDRAEALIEERTRQLAPVLEAITAAEAELAALPDVSQPEAIDLAALELQATRAEEAERDQRAVVVRCTQAVEGAEQAAEKRAALEVELRGIEDEQADWTRLAQDLGRDGLQALEIDAALPELNTVANELLASCVGTRFTIELRSDRLTADGKTVEALEARVIDTQEGRDADAATYSPGELVIVSEAIALALTTRACRQNGVERPTLIRDETGAALSTENGRAYIRMLRRAAQLVGADKVLFVTHSQELQELADVRVEISADHQITIGGAV